MTKKIAFDSNNFTLSSGKSIFPLEIAYETFGKLNKERTNAILICHALTGEQYVSDINPITKKPGWWDILVGKNKPIDTSKYFIICPNVIGGCMGSTGPTSINPKTKQPYGLAFPVITIHDMVKSQVLLIDHLEIDKLLSVIGGSMGGMQVLEWMSSFPKRIKSAIPIATAANHSSQNIAFHEVGRQAIMADPNWHDGKYFEYKIVPEKGLSVARMAAHITYLSEMALQNKFGRNLQDRSIKTFSFDADFQVESYLRYQGINFVKRFDANTYLYLTRAMDYFDLISENGGVLANAFNDLKASICVISFSGDWLFPTSESKKIVHALNAKGVDVSFIDIESNKGHDAFLMDEPDMFLTINGFLQAQFDK
ncbi:MAG: homoserine O-acetyltransferase [Hyphomicrobiales bacterium]|nr:homoserine O-acetyltransferase [Hyphomicrobiales bacterium]